MPSSQNVLPTNVRELIGQFSFIVILVTLIWLPIPKAGMLPGALSVLILSMALVFVSSVLANLHRQQNNIEWLMVWVYFSIVVLVHILFSSAFTDWSGFIGLSHTEREFSRFDERSLDVLRTASSWAFFTTMWVAAWRISLLTTKQIQYLFLAILLASSFQAIYGLAHYLSGADSVMGLWVKEYYLSDATGTFVNRNHYAGMLAISWPIVLSGLIARSPLLLVRNSLLFRSGVAVFYSLIVLIALFASHSRMGLAAALLGVIVWGGMSWRSNRKAKKVSSLLLPAILVTLVILFSIWFGIDEIVQRYTALGSGDSRTAVWVAMFDLPMTAWFLGIGLGSFEDVFHLVQPPSLSVRFLYAHNDYLEFLLEFGLVFTLMGAFIIYRWLRKIVPPGDLLYRAGILGSVSAVALHSLVDFNLQIPANAFFFWAAVGLMLNPNMVGVADNRVKAMTRGKVRLRRRSKIPRNKQEWLAFFRSD